LYEKLESATARTPSLFFFDAASEARDSLYVSLAAAHAGLPRGIRGIPSFFSVGSVEPLRSHYICNEE
jgi:hypothetical protein